MWRHCFSTVKGIGIASFPQSGQKNGSLWKIYSEIKENSDLVQCQSDVS